MSWRPTHCYGTVEGADVRFEGEDAFGRINDGPWLRLKTVRHGLFSAEYAWPVFPPANPQQPLVRNASGLLVTTANAKWHPPRPRA